MQTARNLFISLFTFFMLAGIAIAGPVNVDGDGIALQGHDPVAYFTKDKAVAGDAAITAEHDGATYRFSSAENRDLFVVNPEKYAPQYGGFCAFGMASGYQAPVEADKFTVVDGKLYLNYNGSVQSNWRKDIAGFVSKADAAWLKQ